MYAVSPVTKAAVEKAKPLVLESWVLTRARLLWVVVETIRALEQKVRRNRLSTMKKPPYQRAAQADHREQNAAAPHCPLQMSFLFAHAVLSRLAMCCYWQGLRGPTLCFVNINDVMAAISGGCPFET